MLGKTGGADEVLAKSHYAQEVGAVAKIPVVHLICISALCAGRRMNQFVAIAVAR